MGQLLPLLLDWLSVSPDPDLGLLGLRTLVVRSHHRALVVTTFRESPEAARRLCLVLGSSRAMAEAIERNPELIAELDDDRGPGPGAPGHLVDDAIERLAPTGRRRASAGPPGAADPGPDAPHRHPRPSRHRRHRQHGRGPHHRGRGRPRGRRRPCGRPTSPSAWWAWAGWAGPRCPTPATSTCSSSSTTPAARRPRSGREEAAEALLRFVHGPSPSQRVATIDLGLRPEGGQGRLARDLAGYQTYFDRWAQTWERQALLRARVVAGDRDLGRALHGAGPRLRLGPTPDRRRRGRHPPDEGPHRAGTHPAARGPAVPSEARAGDRCRTSNGRPNSCSCATGCRPPGPWPPSTP